MAGKDSGNDTGQTQGVLEALMSQCDNPASVKIANTISPKSGYSRSNGGFGAAPPANTALYGTTSVSAYVYSASPVNVGQTGVRGFAGDSSGVICFSATGVHPPQNGSGGISITPTTCNVLQ